MTHATSTLKGVTSALFGRVQVWRGEDGEFEVECILDAQGLRSGDPRFHIRWRGYGPEDDTWEPLECLDNSPFGCSSSPLRPLHA
jgi:hypothetical protein